MTHATNFEEYLNDTEDKQPEEPDYTKKERAYRAFLIDRATDDRDERAENHAELDGMSYEEYYESNRKKDLSYVPPKKNKQDVRIVTGTTREKDTTLLSSLLNLNLEPDVKAFDEDNLYVNELGSNMEDLVEKSRQMEDYERKKPKFYREMIAQGDVFVRDVWVDKFKKVPDEELNWNPTEDDPSPLNFDEKLKRVYSRAEHQMIPGKNVFLGDLRTEYAQDQPRVTILNVMPREEAKSIYGNWTRWKNVPKTIDTTEALNPYDFDTYRSWSLTEHNQDEVAELTIYDAANNRLMIMLNGVMMLPIDYPLTSISPDGNVPIVQGKHEIINNFAYSKSQPSKTKVDQEVIDEATKLMIEKFRQGAKPPKGNEGKKVFGSEIFRAGRVTSDINERDLFDIIENPGPTNADFSFYQLFKESINEKTVNDVFSGNVPDEDMTATQAVQMKEQQLMKLGAAMDGAVNLERSLTKRRIYTIIDKWTDPKETNVIDEGNEKTLKDVYRTMSIPTTLENGESGIKEVRFRTKAEEVPSEAKIEQEEEDESERRGQPVRIVYMNPLKLGAFDGKWYVQVNATPNNEDKLSQMVFIRNIKEAMSLFGRQAMNMEYLKQRFAVNIDEDYNKLFKDMGIMEMVRQRQQGNPQVAQNAAGAMSGDTGPGVTAQDAAQGRPPQTKMPNMQMADSPEVSV